MFIAEVRYNEERRLLLVQMPLLEGVSLSAMNQFEKDWKRAVVRAEEIYARNLWDIERVLDELARYRNFLDVPFCEVSNGT